MYRKHCDVRLSIRCESPYLPTYPFLASPHVRIGEVDGRHQLHCSGKSLCNRPLQSRALKPLPFVEQEVGTKQLGGIEIACLEMGEVPTDRVRAPFLAVGDWNGSVKVLGLSPENLLEQVAVMNLLAPAESLCLVHMAAEQAAGGSNEQLFLYVGLTNGVCQRVR